MVSRHPHSKRVAIYTALLFCLFIIVDGASGLLTRLDNAWLDTLVRAHAQHNSPDPEIVIIDIDADSLHQLNSFAGSWPWPRSVHATLIETLHQQHPKAIVFDIFFNEPDIERPESDQLFIDALSTIDNVFFPVYEKVDADKNAGQLIQELPATLNFVKGKNVKPDAKASLITPDAIPSELWKVGAVNQTLDTDYVERRYNIYRTFGGWRLPSLPTRLASYLGFSVPNQKEFILNWQHANPISYPTFPYSQVLVNLTQKIDYPSKNYFANKIIVIGSTAINTQAHHVTPISQQQPSAQVLATAIDNLKNHSFLTRPLGAFANTFFALLFFALLLIIFIKTKFNIAKTTLSLTIFSALLLFISYIGVGNKILIPVAGKLWWVWSYLIVNLLWQYGYVAYNRYRAHTLFSRALSPEALHCLSAGNIGHQQDYTRKANITVLCCYVSQLSALAQQQEATSFVTLLNDYITQQLAIIFKQHGTLHSVIGDTLIAFWGAPMPAEKQAAVAVSSAIQMIDNINIFKKKYQLTDLHISIGVHTGPATVGMIGAHQHLHYSAVGHTIDAAKKMAQLTTDKSIVIISDDTKNACHDDFTFIDLGSHSLLTHTASITLFEPKRK